LKVLLKLKEIFAALSNLVDSMQMLLNESLCLEACFLRYELLLLPTQLRLAAAFM
jgi:hypothetical protein